MATRTKANPLTHDPVIREYLERLHARYGKYALPAEEVRKIVDESMGDKSLTQVLFEMRREGY